MNKLNCHCACLAAVLIAVAVGCEQQTQNASQTAAPVSPEESFNDIVKTFKRGVQDVPIGFVVQEAGGHTMMTGQNKVRHELIPPAKEGDPYRGIITVVSESRYSIQRPVEPGSDEPANKGTDSSTPPNSTDGVQIFDSAVVGTPAAEGQNASATPEQPGASAAAVTRKVDRQERKYELVHENGRWVLTTKTDPNTEKSIQYAFDRALENQI